MAFWLPVGILLIVAGIAMWVGVRHPPRQWWERR
jgi:hypothetical protein